MNITAGLDDGVLVGVFVTVGVTDGVFDIDKLGVIVGVIDIDADKLGVGVTGVFDGVTERVGVGDVAAQATQSVIFPGSTEPTST
jgi:hypothetical protein